MATRQNPALKRFLGPLFLVSILYLVVLAAATWSLRHAGIEGPVRYLIAALPGLPMTVIIALFGRYMREEPDEFERSVLAQSVLWSCGIVLGALSVWGTMEDLAGAPRFPLWAIFSAILVVQPLVQTVIRLRYR